MTICDNCGGEFEGGRQTAYCPKCTVAKLPRTAMHGQMNYDSMPDHSKVFSRAKTLKPLDVQHMTPERIIRAVRDGLL